jgi:hypothetical protein
VLLVVVSGCDTVSTQQRPDDYGAYRETAVGTESLFPGDSKILSDSDIDKILSYRYKPPQVSRVAILPAGWTQWGRWSEEMSMATQQIDLNTIRTLRASPRIYDASFLASILIPKERTVPYLREAAARYQADLLLVYRSACRTFEKTPLFSASSSRAYCSVEAVVLDVRTGIVPFTSTSTQVYETTTTKNDMNSTEAVLRAQLEAISKAMSEIANALVGFLNGS